MAKHFDNLSLINPYFNIEVLLLAFIRNKNKHEQTNIDYYNNFHRIFGIQL